MDEVFDGFSCRPLLRSKVLRQSILEKTTWRSISSSMSLSRWRRGTAVLVCFAYWCSGRLNATGHVTSPCWTRTFGVTPYILLSETLALNISQIPNSSSWRTFAGIRHCRWCGIRLPGLCAIRAGNDRQALETTFSSECGLVVKGPIGGDNFTFPALTSECLASINSSASALSASFENRWWVFMMPIAWRPLKSNRSPAYRERRSVFKSFYLRRRHVP